MGRPSRLAARCHDGLPPGRDRGLSKPYATVAPALAELVHESGQNRIVDLASGGGGPWPELEGIRTIFSGLHHFDETEVRSILRAAQEARVPFLAAEATHRSIRGIFTTLFIPLLVLGLMPRVRPRRALPLILTYIPPILPILIWWDGFASTMRSYRAEELRSLIGDIEEPGYSWRVEELSAPGVPIPVTIVVGRPVES